MGRYSMDSHSFRIVSRDLVTLLEGARLEKIHGPRPGVLTFTFFAKEQKRRLVLRHERQSPLLFFCAKAPDNPSRPPAAVMRLRKYCGGRRLGPAVVDYAARSLAFSVLVPPEDVPCWLLLDMVNGAFAVQELPEGFGEAPRWPAMDVVDSLCAIPWRKGGAGGVWREYAVLTPLLRETLAALEPLEGRALMADLETGKGDLFLYTDNSGCPALYAAWPLPEIVCERLSIAPYPEDALLSLKGEPYPALAAVALTDEPKFFAELARAAHKETAFSTGRSSKKQSRLLARLEQEKKRLIGMLARREDAVALQEILWRYPPETRLESVQAGGEGGGPLRRITLNPLLSVRENMARMFKESARGARGLAMLETRLAQLLAPAPEAAASGTQTASDNNGAARSFTENTGKGAVSKNVARFRSSDGFTLLRGKNAKGNQSLLKIGASHDLWLHAEDGPSAHLLIRRSHAAEEIPEQTLREAAMLVGEKSWQRNEAKARVMVALLRHVHPIKGAAPGTVKVETVLRTVIVPLLREKEEQRTEPGGESSGQRPGYMPGFQ